MKTGIPRDGSGGNARDGVGGIAGRGLGGKSRSKAITGIDGEGKGGKAREGIGIFGNGTAIVQLLIHLNPPKAARSWYSRSRNTCDWTWRRTQRHNRVLASKDNLSSHDVRPISVKNDAR